MRDQKHTGRALRIAGLFLLTLSLAGCVVAPYGPYWHPYHYYR